MSKLIVVFVLAMFAACVGNPEPEEPAETATPEATEEVAAPDCTDEEPEAPAEAGDLDEKPEIEIPDSDPPCDLVIHDLIEGDGDEAEEGASIVVHYVGVSWSTGEEFDSSWERGDEGTPLSLQQVIPGWQEGIPGMKEGGRRQLIIPPDMAYGAQGRPGIAPNETLVFVIDLLDANAEPD